MSEKNKSKKVAHRATFLLDILIPIFGEWDLAEKALAAIPEACEGLNDNYRITVLDNGTPSWTDNDGNEIDPRDQANGVKDLLRPEDRFIRVEQNMGYPGGLNYLVAHSTGAPLMLILTSDVELQAKAIFYMVKVMDDPSVGMVGPKLVFPPGSPHGPAETIQHAGVAFSIKGDPFHILIGWPKDHPKANFACDVGAVTGACFVTRRRLWLDIGGLKPEYGAGTYEDMEYCFEVRERELRIVYFPDAWGYHYVGGSIKQGANPNGFNLAMNRMIFRGRWAHRLAWDEWRRW